MGAIFGGNEAPAMPAPPTLAAVTPMPVPNDAAAKLAQKRKYAGRARASGRASTILSQGDDSDLLGA